MFLVKKGQEKYKIELIGNFAFLSATLGRGQRDGGEEGRLAAFVDHKRQAKKKYKLSAERIKLMETIPKFDW